MSEVNGNELGRIAMKLAKSDLVKTDLANDMIRPGGWGNINNSVEENEKLDEKSKQCCHDYMKYHDWKHDSEYQKLMNKPI